MGSSAAPSIAVGPASSASGMASIIPQAGVLADGDGVAHIHLAPTATMAWVWSAP